MTEPPIPQLHKITALVKFAFQCELYDVRGIKDTTQKLAACYFAKKLTEANDTLLSKFFQINPDFMKDRVESYAVHLLLDPKAKKIHETMEQLFLEIEMADV